MSREVEMLAMVIADLRLQVETLKESVNRRDALIDETNAKTEDSVKAQEKTINELKIENGRLRASITRAGSELRMRITDTAEFEGVYGALMRGIEP